MRLRDRLHVGAATQRRLTWLMEVTLVGIFFIGLYTGETGVFVNAGIGLLVAQLPPLLERDFNIPMDAGLTLWITAAVFLHALGTVPLPAEYVALVGSVEPGQQYASLYGSSGWDHLTHALSASVVAGVGYATARALDEHSDQIYLPPKFTFVFILLFVLAFGVLWEVIEFLIGIAAASFGFGSVLTQYGLEDTMLDLVFDIVGGVIVAIWGTAHLTGVVGALTRHLDGRNRRNA